MNISSNPWSFTSADVTLSTPAATPNGFVQDAFRLARVTYTSTGAHNLSVGQYVTAVNTTGGRFLGFYRVLVVIDATHAILENISSPTLGSPFNTVLAGDGGGSLAVCQYPWMIRGEDLSWLDSIAADTIDVRDRNGNVVWKATATGSSNPTRGKPLWHDGLTLLQMSGGILIETIN